MTTYKSEMIEFRAGRIILTEAEWTANTNVYPEGIIAITSDGSNAGRTKVFDGTSYWSQLAYNSGGGGAVTSDDVTDESILADPLGRPLTETLDAISQTFSDITGAITALTQSKVDAYVDGTQHNVIITVTGTCDGSGRLTVNLGAASGGRPALASANLISAMAGASSGVSISGWEHVATLATYTVQFWDNTSGGPASEATPCSFTVIGTSA